MTELLDDEERDAIAAIRRAEGMPRVEWPAAVKEFAFELWSFKHGQNAAAVARELAEGDDAVKVPERTIRAWAIEDEWATKAVDRMAELAPAMRGQVIAELVAGSLDAMRYIRQVARGDHEKPDKVRLEAARDILDRFGIVPPRNADTNAVAQLPPRAKQHDDAPIDMSPAAAMERMRLRREQQWQR